MLSPGLESNRVCPGAFSFKGTLQEIAFLRRALQVWCAALVYRARGTARVASKNPDFRRCPTSTYCKYVKNKEIIIVVEAGLRLARHYATGARPEVKRQDAARLRVKRMAFTPTSHV